MADLLSKERAKELYETVMKYSTADETEVTLASHVDEHWRFGNNVLAQPQYSEGTRLDVRVIIGKKTARQSTDRLQSLTGDMEEYIKNTVDKAIENAKKKKDEEDLLEMPGPQKYTDIGRFYDDTIYMPGDEKASIVKKAIDVAKEKGFTSSGILSVGAGYLAMINSSGLFAYHKETEGEFSVTMDADNGNVSGWSRLSFADLKELDSSSEAMIQDAVETALANKEQKEVPPGKYTVVLAPNALSDMIPFILMSPTYGPDFGVRQYREGSSFLVGKLGKKVAGENVTIHDDVYHSGQSGAPFDGEGFPKSRVTLIENGILKDVVSSRMSEAKYGVKSTGHEADLPNPHGESPSNLVMEGNDKSFEELVRGMDKGILMKRAWYIRPVDPVNKIVTGMTRDGTFWVEGGEIKYAIKNLRFNQSMLDLLNNIEDLSRPTRNSSDEFPRPVVCPAIKVRDFNFTGITKF